MATIQLRRPFRRAAGFDSVFDQLWRGFGPGPRARAAAARPALPLDIEQNDERLVITASLPGYEPGDIEVSVDEDILTIKAERPDAGASEDDEPAYLLRERRYGAVSRSLRLPENLDAESAESEFRNGVLAVTFPKVEQVKPRQIEVKASN
ncbi:MAG: Hsp20/alpha crystallin family protein [Chloroflexota bacterium]|nr:Hsp20/alpha crystallin family protein [Chloroflexota bacterium]